MMLIIYFFLHSPKRLKYFVSRFQVKISRKAANAEAKLFGLPPVSVKTYQMATVANTYESQTAFRFFSDWATLAGHPGPAMRPDVTQVPNIEKKEIYREYLFTHREDNLVRAYADPDRKLLNYVAFCRHIKDVHPNVTFHKAKTVALKCHICAEFLSPGKGSPITRKEKSHLSYLQALHRSM